MKDQERILFTKYLEQAAAQGMEVIELAKSGIETEFDAEAADILLSQAPRLRGVKVFRGVKHFFRGDALEKLLAAIAHFAELRVLDLSDADLGDQVTAWLESLPPFSSLNDLMLSGNRMGDTGGHSIAAIAHRLPQLKSLCLVGCEIATPGLLSLLRATQEWPQISVLRLGKNFLGNESAEVVAAEAGSLRGLKELELGRLVGDEGLRALARSLARLESLERLSLEHNFLRDEGLAALASAECRLRRLHTLDFSNNQVGNGGFESLIAAARGFPELKALIVAFNNIGSAGLRNLPSLGGLPALETLDLRNNMIDAEGATALAEAALQLPDLVNLQLNNNFISDAGLEPLLAAVQQQPWGGSLRTLALAGNPITRVWQELALTDDASAWRAYAERTGRAREMYLPEVKLLILGEGRVGKTHLRERLFGGDTRFFDPWRPSTHDIDATRWMTHVEREGRQMEVAVSVWDFGGQRELHSSHRFFLSEQRGVFLIVCDATRTRRANRLDYWLRKIRHEGSARGPIIVVITKCDGYEPQQGRCLARRLEELDADELRRSGGFDGSVPLTIVDGVGTCGSSDDGQGDPGARHDAAMTALVSAIDGAINQVPELTVRYPREYVAAVRWLQSAGFAAAGQSVVKAISASEFRDVCSRAGLDSRLAKLALETAHNIGAVHYVGHFASVRSGDELAELIFNPAWIRTPVYTLLRARDQTRGGVAEWEIIEKILPEHQGRPGDAVLFASVPFSPSDRRRVLDLMSACELVFELPRRGRKPGYFLPDHLDGLGEVGAPEGAHVWKRGFKWLPESIFGRFVGRLYQYSSQDGALVWRDQITLDVEPHLRITVRLSFPPPAKTHASWEDAINEKAPGAEVYVAVSGCDEAAAKRHLDRIAGELRIIRDEPTFEDGIWVRVRGMESGSEVRKQGLHGEEESAVGTNVTAGLGQHAQASAAIADAGLSHPTYTGQAEIAGRTQTEVSSKEQPAIVFGRLRVVPGACVRVEGCPDIEVALGTHQTHKVFVALVEAMGRSVSADTLKEVAWGPNVQVTDAAFSTEIWRTRCWLKENGLAPFVRLPKPEKGFPRYRLEAV